MCMIDDADGSMDEIPFDVDAFRNGAIAIVGLSGREVSYEDEDDFTIFTSCPCTVIDKVMLSRGISNSRAWKMKPTQQDEGWIPVINGKCPKEIECAKANEWERKFSNGIVETVDCYATHPCLEFGDVVAVRIIKQTEKQNKTAPTVCVRCGATEEIMRKHGCAATIQGLPICDPAKMFDARTIETAQQTRTREASTKYFANLHAKQAPVRPLGEAGIDDIAAAALDSFEAELERKRK